MSKCDACWKSWIWACPLLCEIPKNIISCSAYEPSQIYIKTQEIFLEIVEDLNYFVYWDIEQLKDHLDKTQKKWKKKLDDWHG